MFNFFGSVHPIVISEILSFSSKGSGKNLLNSVASIYDLENSLNKKSVYFDRYLNLNDSEKNYTEILESKWIRGSENGLIDDIKFILKHYDSIINTSVSFKKTSALILASHHDHHDIVKLLLNHPDIDVNYQNKRGVNILLYEIFSYIRGDEVSYRNNMFLMGLENVKNLLNRHDIDVNLVYKNLKILNIAVDFRSYTNEKYRNRIEIILQLLLNHPNIDINFKMSDSKSRQYGETPLITAVSKNYIEIVELLLNHSNIDVNLQDGRGNTALMVAASKNYIEIVELLLNHPNIDVNLQNKREETALILAAIEDNIKIVKLLLEHKDIKVNVIDDVGNTALYGAVLGGNTEIVSELLDHIDIDVNLQYYKGATVLITSVIFDHIEIAKLLLKEHDTDVNIKDDDGHTALYYAKLSGNKEFIDLLLNDRRIIP